MKRMATSAAVSVLALMAPLASQAPAAASPISCEGIAFYETTVTDRGYFGSPMDAGTRIGTVSVGSVVCAQAPQTEGRYYELYQEHSNQWLEVTFLSGPSSQSSVYIPAVYLTEWNDDDLA